MLRRPRPWVWIAGLIWQIGLSCAGAADFGQLWQQWRSTLSGPVRYLLTESEREQLEAVVRDPAALRRFVELFWARRSPGSRSRTNLFEADLRARILEADQRFREPDLPGWETHRGILFIVLGEPDSTDKTLNNGIRNRYAKRPVIRWWYRRDRIDSCRDNPSYFIFTFLDDRRDGHHWLVPNLPTLFRCTKKRAHFPVLSTEIAYRDYRTNGIPPLLFEQANQSAIYHQEVELDFLPAALDAGAPLSPDQIELPFTVTESREADQRQIVFRVPYAGIPYRESGADQVASLEFCCRAQAGALPVSRQLELHLSLEQLSQRAEQSLVVALDLPRHEARAWECWYLSKIGQTLRSASQTVQLQP